MEMTYWAMLSIPPKICTYSTLWHFLWLYGIMAAQPLNTIRNFHKKPCFFLSCDIAPASYKGSESDAVTVN